MKKPQTVALDALDLKILRAVQEDNLAPQRVIGESIGLSPPAVARRLQNLRESGVIRKDVSVVDGHAVGRPLTIIAHVTTENERLELLDAMKERFLRCPQIQQCYYVTGDMDFILIFNVRDMAEYTELTRALFFEGGNVKSFRTCVSMQNIKTDGPVPL
ncbi:Lrp/AsnC family transcriptional regulator [Aureimonas frigidaquae]|uniref:Regulator for leucine regulon and high-affinity branched-chain amino acid transport system n=1 Tax=Aureimonas frigidaquae TaxID=424757 RepID=A0A0P0Z0G6_9HYPH|nr:Lrp/AsnC family transcriptional regulator [Aureimonas frigidaquae]BAT27438.1 regulator for leucine regulon and high-affinity branched-chain amino acid transport system [Aureimonas frigidaquae]